MERRYRSDREPPTSGSQLVIMITLAGLGLYSLMEDREEPASGGRIVLPDEQPWRPAEVGARRSPDGESESP